MSDLDFVFGTGGAWTDLLGTLKYSYTDHSVERLTTPERAAEWFEAVGFALRQPLGQCDLERVRELRGALAAIAHARLGMPQSPGAPDFSTAMATLRAATATHTEGLLDTVASPRRTGHRDIPLPLDAVLEGIVTSALSDLVQRPQDFGHCADDGCRKIFLDPSHSRKACSTTCATRLRVRAYRHKGQQAPA